MKKVLRQLTKAADSTSDSGVHSGSEIDSVCGGEEKTRGDKEKDKHDCVQPPILSTIFQSAAERGVTGEETMLIRGLHMYSNGEILKAKEEEEESDDEQCADEKVSTEIHYPAVSSHPACNFNYYEAVNFLWNGMLLQIYDLLANNIIDVLVHSFRMVLSKLRSYNDYSISSTLIHTVTE